MGIKAGRYIILKKLAEGGMAEIHLARRVSYGGFGRFTVLKQLLPQHRGRRAYEKLFAAEARIAATLDHPNVISIHDLGKMDNVFFMAMEYVHGVSGAQLMQKVARSGTPIGLASVVRIVSCMGDALHHCAHAIGPEGAMGILHNDVSPHNIQIGFDGTVKLLDFGVATEMGKKTTGGRRGKHAYMSPEGIQKEPLDHRSDVFSLGIVLYELALNRRLFKSATPEETMERVTSGVYDKPTAIDSQFPAGLEEIIERAIAVNRDERYPTAQAMADDLRAFADAQSMDLRRVTLRRRLGTVYGEDVERRQNELLLFARSVNENAFEESGTELPAMSPTSDIDGEESIPIEPTPTPIPQETSIDAYAEGTGNLSGEFDILTTASFEIPGYGKDPTPPPPVETPPPYIAPPPTTRTGFFIAAIVAAIVAGGAWFVGERAGRLHTEMGSVYVDTNPTGARVFNGDALLGVTPFETKRLPVGTLLRLRFQHDSYQTQHHTVSILPDRPHRSVFMALKKTIP